MAQEKTNPKKVAEEGKKVVAAIDFGSTYSGYAFSFRDDFQTNPLKIHTNHWSSVQSGGISYKAPTTVLLKPDQTFHSYGYDAEDKYAELSEAEEHQEWYYFSRFKMKLMNALDISKDQTGSDRLFSKLDRDIESDDIDVPAIWTDSAKQFTREAAKETGFHDDQLMIAYEPEPAALYCRLLPIDRFGSGGKHQELVLKTFERGKKFMVIDLEAYKEKDERKKNQLQRNHCCHILQYAIAGEIYTNKLTRNLQSSTYARYLSMWLNVVKFLGI